jgi:hypothetical protein
MIENPNGKLVLTKSFYLLVITMKSDILQVSLRPALRASTLGLIQVAREQLAEQLAFINNLLVT